MIKWVVTPNCQSHRSYTAVNYPTVLCLFRKSDSNVRMNSFEGNIMFTDREFMEGVVLMCENSPTFRDRLIAYARSIDKLKTKPVNDLAELLL